MIEPDLIAACADVVHRQGLDELAIAALRATHPALHFTLCSADDVPARLSPALSRDGFKVYLVVAGGHCVGFTAEPEHASGLVFATVDEDA